MAIKRLVITVLIAAAVTVVAIPIATAQPDKGASDEETSGEEERRLAGDDPRAFGVPYSLEVAFLTMSALVAAGGLGIGLKRYKRNDPFIEQRTQQQPQETRPDELEPEWIFTTVQVLSKQVLVLLIATLVLSAYLIQRSFTEIIAGGLFIEQKPTSGQI